MAKKLHYFDTIGIAESIRYMLHYSKQKFEDVRHDYKTWPIEDVKKNLPFGQLPFYEEGNKSLYQSIAIARYIAATSNLLPSDPWDQAQMDAVVLSVYDFAAKVTVVLKEQDPVKKETLKNVFDEAVEFYFTRFDDQLKNNQGFFGGTLSWADFIFIGFLEAVNLHSNKQIEGNYPHVAKLMETIKTLPGVTEYISTRKSYLSWADFIFIGFLEAVNLHSNKQIEGNYPHVAKLMETIKTLPGVTEYISTRKSYVI